MLFVPLAACTMLRREEAAAAAKVRMIGMSREDVLGCMGPPGKKNSEGATEVWSYVSSDGHSRYYGDKIKWGAHYQSLSSARDRKFCTVNVVMKDGFVKTVRYLGPSGTSWFTTQDQCGYAVAACVGQEDGY